MSRFEDSFSEMLRARAGEAEGGATPSPAFLARIARRRIRNAGTALASIVLVVAGTFAAVGAARTGEDDLIGPGPTPSPTGSAAPDAPFRYQMLDVYAVDRQSAFVLTGGGCNPEGCLSGLLYTSDAGRRWIRRATPFQVRGAPDTKVFSGGFFASAERGWLFRNGTTYETTNGGLSWHVRADLGGVEAIERGSDSLWASTTTCAGGSCRSFVLRSTDQGATWTRTSISGFKVGRVFGINNSAAWILQDATASSDYAFRRTADGGRTWVAQPPLPPRCDRTRIVFGTTTTLIAVCGSEPATAMQEKSVWAFIADPSGRMVWGLQSTSGSRGGLPDTGHVSLMYSSPGTVWLWLDRGGLFNTADNGVTWIHNFGNDGDPELRGASFPVRGSAWVVLGDNSLRRASSGEFKGWQQVSFPATQAAELEAMPICTPGPTDNRPPTNEELGHPAVCRTDPKSANRVPCGVLPGQPPCKRPASRPR